MLETPPWMIEWLERQRREREAREQPVLWHDRPELPPSPPDRDPRPAPSTVVVIDLG
jgi:hypothetical protein